MTPRRITLLLLLAIFACCSEGRDGARTLTVFAAASLATVFEQLADQFELANTGARVAVHAAGTPHLVMQLLEGARADVFASADVEQMQRLADAGLTNGTPVAFAHNRMVLITPADRDAIQSLRDLAAPGLRILLCAPNVPAGHYARKVLTKAGITVTSLSDEPNVHAVTAKVALGLADAAIVYTTDARSDPTIRRVEIDPQFNTRATCPIAMLKNAHHPDLAERFVQFVLGEHGRRALAEHGFELP